MQAFVPLCGAFTGVRLGARAACPPRRERSRAAAPPTRRARTRASLAGAAALLPATLHVAEENLYGTIFLGGLGIIGSGIVGAFIVSLLARMNFAELERDFVYRDMTEEERAGFEKQAVVLREEKIAEEERKANSFLQSESEEAAGVE